MHPHIPKRIIQTAKHARLPLQQRAVSANLKLLNPDFEYLFFDNEGVERFIDREFPQYRAMFDAFPFKIQRYDFFRYLAVYHYGGFYFDLDVLLAAFGRYRSRLPSEGRPYLELLRREVERERQPASRTVRAGLSSDGWRQWIGAWRTFLGSPVPRRSTLARAMQPVYEVATACIDRSLAKVTKHGGRIASDTPAEALHRLRLKVKRLRYLVEGFRSLYAADAIADLIGALKTFQDYLGAHQDLEVHARAIGAHAARLEADARATPAVRAAVRGLTDALSEERPAGIDGAQAIAARLTKTFGSATPEARDAVQVALRLYRENVFPQMKITWGTYTNQLFHVDDGGCFRCHDDTHVAKGNPDKKISQNCELCHKESEE